MGQNPNPVPPVNIPNPQWCWCSYQNIPTKIGSKNGRRSHQNGIPKRFSHPRPPLGREFLVWPRARDPQLVGRAFQMSWSGSMSALRPATCAASHGRANTLVPQSRGPQLPWQEWTKQNGGYPERECLWALTTPKSPKAEQMGDIFGMIQSTEGNSHGNVKDVSTSTKEIDVWVCFCILGWPRGGGGGPLHKNTPICHFSS